MAHSWLFGISQVWNFCRLISLRCFYLLFTSSCSLFLDEKVIWEAAIEVLLKWSFSYSKALKTKHAIFLTSLLIVTFWQSATEKAEAIENKPYLKRKLLKGFVLSEKNTMDRTRRREKKRWTEEEKRKGKKKKGNLKLRNWANFHMFFYCS